MNRRSFLRGLLSLSATAAAGVAIVEPEPVRRFWQVGRGAPVGDQPWTREYLFGYDLMYGNDVARSPAGRMAIAEDFMKHGLLSPEDAVRVFTMPAGNRIAFTRPSIGYDAAWDTPIPADAYLDAKARYGHEAAELQPFVPVDPTPQPQRYEFPIRVIGSREVVVDEEGTRRWAWMESAPIHTARITGIKS